MRRITEGFGQRLEEKREREAQQVYAPIEPQLADKVVVVTAPILEQPTFPPTAARSCCERRAGRSSK
jgi:hypothetical protein